MIGVHEVELRLSLYGDRNQSNRIGDDVAIRLISQCDVVRSPGRKSECPEQVPHPAIRLLVHGDRG